MLQGPGLRATAEQAIVRVMNMNGMASAISPEHGKKHLKKQWVSSAKSTNPASTPEWIKAADLAALVGRDYLCHRLGADRREHRLRRQEHHEYGCQQARSRRN
jgi:hypothetical protein